MKNKIKILGVISLILAIGFSMVSCSNGGTQGVNNKTNRIGTKIISSSADSRSVTDQSEEISAMYFGLFDITAYQYSPGFSEDPDGNRAFRKDWAYYNIVDDGYRAARDIVLFKGSEVDLAVLNPYQYELSEQFIAEYDSFSIDFLQVCISSPAVFFNNTLYGTHWAGNKEWEEEFTALLLEKYPNLDNFDIYDFGFSYYLVMEGAEKFDVNFSVLFAREDWFPEPVFAYLETVDVDGSYTSKTYTYEWSSKPLTDEQIKYLEGVASNPGASWYRRSFIVIPYSLPKFFEDKSPAKMAVKEGAEGMKNPEFRISFDFKQLLTDETYENIINEGSWNQSSDGSNPQFTFKSSGGIPFGLRVNVVDVE